MSAPKKRRITASQRQVSDVDTNAVVVCEELVDAIHLEHIKQLRLPQTLATAVSLLHTRSKEAGFGWYSVAYEQKHGRLYAKGPSLQRLKGWVLRMSTPDLYWDIDMKNAAPNCLAFVLKTEFGVVPPTLQWYIDDRDEIFVRLTQKYDDLKYVTPSQFKKAFLSSMHGGNHLTTFCDLGIKVNGPVPELTDFEGEIHDVSLRLRNTSKYAKIWHEINMDDSRINKHGSFISIVWQTVEAEILMHMHEFFTRAKEKVCVLKHDGLYLYRNGRAYDFPVSELRRCEASIKEVIGIDISLCEKQLTQTSADIDAYYGPKNLALIRSDFDRLVYQVMRTGFKKSYKRFDGFIMKPHTQIPGVYVRGEEGTHFINEVSVKNHLLCSEIEKKKVWFDSCDHPRFPLVTAKDFANNAISFINGYLDTDTLIFTLWENVQDPPLTRHYFEKVLPSNPNQPTPLWNRILYEQLSYENDDGTLNTDIVDAFEELLGRTFYPIGKYDNWQKCPMVVGDANTGKSSIAECIIKMFPPGDVGAITASFEPRFGLQSLSEKRIVVVPDMPMDIHKRLTASDFQSMVTGDPVSVAVKYKAAFMIKWAASMIWFGNGTPQWSDVRGAIQRRCVIFKFDNLIRDRITNLVQRIVQDELVFIILRALTKYRQKVDSVGTGDYWKSLPERLREWSIETSTQTDPMADFIINGSDYYQVTHKPGHKTSFADLKRAFLNYMQYDRKVKNPKMPTDMHCIKKAGFTIKRLNICKVCGEHAKKTVCGDHYKPQNRSRLTCFLDMEIIKLKDREQHEPFFVG